MEITSNRRAHRRVRRDLTHPSSDSSMDFGYASDSGSSVRSECSSPDPDNMSEFSDRSKDSGPYFKEEPFISSIKKAIEKALKGPVQFAAFTIIVAVLFYTTCSVFSGEKLIKQDVKIILPASSAEEKSTDVTATLLNHIIKEIKQDRLWKALEEIQVEKAPEETSTNANDMLMEKALKIALLRSSVEDKSAAVMEKLLSQFLKELKQEVQTSVRAEIELERGTKAAPAIAEGDGFFMSLIKFPFVVIWSVVKLPFEILMHFIWFLLDIFVPVVKLLFVIAFIALIFMIQDPKFKKLFLSRIKLLCNSSRTGRKK